MKARKLRHRVTLYQQTTGRTPTGAVTKATWTLAHTLWASIEPLSVKDVLTAQAADSETRVRCILRYRADIDSTMQLEHNGKRYQIDGDPLPDAKSGLEYMTLMLRTLPHG